MDCGKVTILARSLLSIAVVGFATMPASAETAFWFTCDFPGEAGQQTISFGLYTSSGEGFITFDAGAEMRPITWYELGGTTHIFLDDVQPVAWALSFDPETQAALTYAEAHVTGSTSCRGGAK